MGYILCKDAEAEQPYYVKELGLSLRSAYELCYFIYNHSALIDDGFPSEEMLRFIGTGCRMPDLERKLRKWKNDGEDVEMLMLTILQDVHYYGERDMRLFSERMNRRRGLPAAEKAKQRADYLLGQKYYSEALAMYEQILRGEFGEPDDGLRGRVRYNSAVAMAGLFLFAEAAEAFAESYEILGQESILRDLCFLYEIDETIPIRSDLIDPVPARNRLFWKEEYENARTRAANEGKALRVRAALEKGAFSRHEAVTALAEEWKNEYRRMSR